MNQNHYLLSPTHMVGLPLGENMRRMRSISQSMDNSLAFLRIPDRRLEYVTCRPLVFSSFLILSFTLPMSKNFRPKLRLNVTPFTNYDTIRWNLDGKYFRYSGYPRRNRAWDDPIARAQIWKECFLVLRGKIESVWEIEPGNRWGSGIFMAKQEVIPTSQRGEIEPRTGEIGSSWVDRAGEKGARREIGVKKEREKEGGEREWCGCARGERRAEREKRGRG